MSIKYEHITTATRADEVCKKLLENKSVSFDTETTGTDPHKDKVSLLSVASRKDGAFVAETKDPRILEAFSPLLSNENIIKIAHNGGFDYKMVKGTTGVETENILCTMLGEYSLTAGLQFNGYGLDDVTQKYLNKTRDKSLQKSFIGHVGAFSKAQLDYSAEDSIDLLDIADKMKDKMKEQGLIKTWLLESSALQSFADMEYYGQKIDKDLWQRSISQNYAIAKQAKDQLDEFFRPVCGMRFSLDPLSEEEYEVDMNYESTPAVLHKLRSLGISVDGALITNTSKKTQKKLQQHPIMKALTKYRTSTKGASAFGEKYLSAINPITGRVHFRFNQYGAETGRPTCRGGLNCLNIPKEKRYRDCFTTEAGRLLSTVDFNGVEMRIMADQSGDPLMIKGYNRGVDFHCFVASLLFGKEVTKQNENAALRTPAKEMSFGLAYGMGPVTLWEKLNAAGYIISLEECKTIFWKYMDTFHVTIGWLKSQQRQASTSFKMTNSNGRIRHWVKPNKDKIRDQITQELDTADTLKNYTEMKIEELVNQKTKGILAAIQREGANFKIQSVSADITKTSMARCRKEFKKRQWDARTYNSVYDEMVYDFHESYATEAHELQKQIMVQSANEFLKHIPMEVEGYLGKSWAK